MQRPRGAESYNESLFITVRLEEFVPQSHPLRPLRAWVNGALINMDGRFSAMYEADIKGGRPSSAPEKQLGAMLLQLLYSVRSERQLVEQIEDDLLFRWYVGLAIEDTVWDHSVNSQEPRRLIEHEAVTELFNATVHVAQERGLLSGEHFGVAGTLIQAWASHKSMRRKDGSDDSLPTPGLAGRASQQRDARVCKRSRVAPVPQEQCGTRATQLPGPCAAGQPPGAGGQRTGQHLNSTSEREVSVQILAEAAAQSTRVTVGAYKAYDTKGFVKACREASFTPHVAQNTARNGGSAIDGRTTRHAGYAVSLRYRKCIERCFGWGKEIGPMRQIMVRGRDKVGERLALTMAVYNLTR